MLLVFVSLSFILCSICIIEDPVAVSKAVHPEPNIPVPQLLDVIFPSALQPQVHPESMLFPIFPLSYIPFVYCEPFHLALPILHVIFPSPFVLISRRVNHRPLSMSQPIKELPFVSSSTRVYKFPFPVPLAFPPLPFILPSFLQLQNSISIPSAPLYGSSVRKVFPFVSSFPMQLTPLELPSIGALWSLQLPLSVQHPQLYLPDVGEAVLKLQHGVCFFRLYEGQLHGLGSLDAIFSF